MKQTLSGKQNKSIILFSILIVALAFLNVVAFTISPDFIKHSEKNTYEVSGIVTEFEYVKPGYWGSRKIRQPHIIHLDNGTDCVFRYLNYEMHYDDPDQEKIKEELEGQYVVIRLSKINDEVITINTNEKCYLSFEASNRQYLAGIIGVALFDLSIVFVLYMALLYPIISGRLLYKQSRTK
ncbi:MAG: hypothetical protein IKW53_05005 [Clostridia bacterium]|nr:hypothetical protein [Clostridia bacterium]